MATFKVGDRVRVIKNPYMESRGMANKSGTITHQNKFGIYPFTVELDRLTFDGQRILYFTAKEIELISPTRKKTKKVLAYEG